MSILADMAYEKSLNDREDKLIAEPTASPTNNEGITVTHAPKSRKARLERANRADIDNSAANKEIIEFISRIMPTGDFIGRHHIRTPLEYIDKDGHKQTNMKLIAHFGKDDFEKVISKLTFRKDTTYYISRNGYFWDKINKENGESCLFTLDNIVIDIDNHDIPAEDVKREVDRLIYWLRSDEYQYSMLSCYDIVRSGRGCHLWVHLDTMYAGKPEWTTNRNMDLYKAVAERLADILRKIIKEEQIALDVDFKASVSPYFLIRVPFTYNQKTGVKSSVEYGNYYRYTQSDLEEWLEETAEWEVPKEQTAPKKPKVAATEQEQGQKEYAVYCEPNEKFRSLDKKQMLFIEWLVKECNGDVTGRRNNLIWVYYNQCCAVLGDRKQALARTLRLNSSFKQPQSENEIRQEIKSVDKVGYYPLTQLKFLENIEATPEERKEWRVFSARDKERENARTAKEQRDSDILEYHSLGLTIKQIAERLNICEKTVKNVLKRKNPNEKAERDTMVLSMYKQGMSISDISSDTGLSYKTVKSIIEKQSSKASPVSSDTSSSDNTDNVIIFPDTLTATLLRETKDYLSNRPLDERLII